MYNMHLGIKRLFIVFPFRLTKGKLLPRAFDHVLWVACISRKEMLLASCVFYLGCRTNKNSFCFLF